MVRVVGVDSDREVAAGALLTERQGPVGRVDEIAGRGRGAHTGREGRSGIDRFDDYHLRRQKNGSADGSRWSPPPREGGIDCAAVDSLTHRWGILPAGRCDGLERDLRTVCGSVVRRYDHRCGSSAGVAQIVIREICLSPRASVDPRLIEPLTGIESVDRRAEAGRAALEGVDLKVCAYGVQGRGQSRHAVLPPGERFVDTRQAAKSGPCRTPVRADPIWGRYPTDDGCAAEGRRNHVVWIKRIDRDAGLRILARLGTCRTRNDIDDIDWSGSHRGDAHNT